MSAAELIEWAAKNGVVVSISFSGGVRISGRQPDIDRWLPDIKENKAKILKWLQPGSDGWSAKDWLEFFNKKTDSAELNGGLTRGAAEETSFAWCINQWFNLNPAPSEPGCCALCHSVHGIIIPYLTSYFSPPGHTWLHQVCSKTWHQIRKENAVDALRAMGVSIPARPKTNLIGNEGE